MRTRTIGGTFLSPKLVHSRLSNRTWLPDYIQCKYIFTHHVFGKRNLTTLEREISLYWFSTVADTLSTSIFIFVPRLHDPKMPIIKSVVEDGDSFWQDSHRKMLNEVLLGFWFHMCAYLYAIPQCSWPEQRIFPDRARLEWERVPLRGAGNCRRESLPSKTAWQVGQWTLHDVAWNGTSWHAHLNLTSKPLAFTGYVMYVDISDALYWDLGTYQDIWGLAYAPRGLSTSRSSPSLREDGPTYLIPSLGGHGVRHISRSIWVIK